MGKKKYILDLKETNFSQKKWLKTYKVFTKEWFIWYTKQSFLKDRINIFKISKIKQM
jgi:hypothetical protein